MKRHNNKKPQKEPFLPILIIPGFMSSGLKVVESQYKPEWVGERLWLNLKALGFEAAVGKHTTTTATTPGGPTVPSNKDTLRDGSHPNDANINSNTIMDLEEGAIVMDDAAEDASNQDDDDDDDDHDTSTAGLTTAATTNQSNTTGVTVGGVARERHNIRLRNAWVQHMALQDDMVSEPDGIRVRPIEGLAGVDYLTPGTLTNGVSYVFGPLIRALEQVGYHRGVNLDAAPYDWRLPPSVLETRDQYYTKTMDLVEQLFHNNHQTPVVLVCHSMGCRIGHYLLNFAKSQHQRGGQAWINRYIHTYCPIGGPHLGAPKSVRSVISGDKMGLETFLSDTEALVMGRSLGSTPLLMPTTLPPDAPASTIIRMEGAIEVTVLGKIDTEIFLNRRESGHRPNKLKLMVFYGGADVSSPFYNIDAEDQIEFQETFVFRTQHTGPLKKQGITILLCEEGSNSARKSNTRARRCHLQCRQRFFQPWKLKVKGKETARWAWPSKENKFLFWLNIIFFWWLIWPLTRYTIESGLKIYGAVLYFVLWMLVQGTTISVDVISKLSGGVSGLAVAKIQGVGPLLLDEARIQKTYETELDLDFVSYRDMMGCCGCRGNHRQTPIKVRLKWIPPESVANPRARAAHIISQTTIHNPPVYETLKAGRSKSAFYRACPGYNLLEAEGLLDVANNVAAVYEKDPLEPRYHSSSDAPPVRNVKAIYGVNRPTEVGAVFRRRRAFVLTPNRINNRFLLDKEARFLDEDKSKPKSDDSATNSRLKQGSSHNKGSEKKQARFTIKHGILFENPSEEKKSGDGTVPYWSLNLIEKWKASCHVSIEELEGAEHREILADKRLHQILVDYCCSKEEVANEQV